MTITNKQQNNEQAPTQEAKDIKKSPYVTYPITEGGLESYDFTEQDDGHNCPGYQVTK